MAYASDVIAEPIDLRLEDVHPELFMKDFVAFGNAVTDPANLGKNYERVCAELNIPPALLGLGVDPNAPPPRIGMSMQAIVRNYNESRNAVTAGMAQDTLAQSRRLEVKE